MTGIHETELEMAPTFSTVAKDIRSLLDGALFVAHNARFDYGFLKQEFGREDISFSSRVLCTARLSRLLYTELPRHNLDTLISHFGFIVENRHRAYPDAAVLWEFLQQVYKDHSEELLLSTFSRILKMPSHPTHLAEGEISKLPETSGVYSMYNENNLLLYVGKSVNIRDRVRSHFSSDYQSATDTKLSSQVHRIEVEETAGELGALIRESTRIKRESPLYNRLLRRDRIMTTVLETEENGYKTISLVPSHMVHHDDVEKILGVFRTEKQAKERLFELTKLYNLCPKLLGLSREPKACFYTHLDICHGACTGEEESFRYNARFVEAFSQLKVLPWPFPGPIQLIERNRKKTESHVIYKWCYVGSLEEETDTLTFENIHFDWDVYKILRKFILRKSSEIHPYSFPISEEANSLSFL
jgi:DNA polymerase-3 subunit epsilon